jgi:hypothetical protein
MLISYAESPPKRHSDESRNPAREAQIKLDTGFRRYDERMGFRRPMMALTQAILPPPILVMATTEGRGGRSSLKSGQRVAGVL